MKKNETENALKYWYKTIEYDNERIEGIINAINHLILFIFSKMQDFSGYTTILSL